MQPHSNGGLSCPQYYMYYLSIDELLSYCTVWWKDNSDKVLKKNEEPDSIPPKS